ncbi:hypothetical protein ACIP5Y_00845 [Nocardia sp. NPDC088792]|uniref:hypothetical protein n=1 Tax=Nocardia sp. NPDC088792 TaxID=3364332 RepID=UPI00381F234C
MHESESNLPRPLRVFVDEAGGASEARIQRWLHEVITHLGMTSSGAALWSTTPGLDLWSMNRDEAATTLEALIDKAESPEEVEES